MKQAIITITIDGGLETHGVTDLDALLPVVLSELQQIFNERSPVITELSGGILHLKGKALPKDGTSLNIKIRV